MTQGIRARPGRAMARSRYARGMLKVFCAMLILAAAAGCSTVPHAARAPSACDLSETSYDCQVERYNNVGID